MFGRGEDEPPVNLQICLPSGSNAPRLKQNTDCLTWGLVKCQHTKISLEKYHPMTGCHVGSFLKYEAIAAAAAAAAAAA